MIAGREKTNVISQDKVVRVLVVECRIKNVECRMQNEKALTFRTFTDF